MTSPLAFLPVLLLPLGTAGALATAPPPPVDGRPMVARFADDAAALAGAIDAGAVLLGAPGPGQVAVAGAPGLAARLRAAGAQRVHGLSRGIGCMAPAGRVAGKGAA